MIRAEPSANNAQKRFNCGGRWLSQFLIVLKTCSFCQLCRDGRFLLTRVQSAKTPGHEIAGGQFHENLANSTGAE